jgi:hypothetical protein
MVNLSPSETGQQAKWRWGTGLWFHRSQCDVEENADGDLERFGSRLPNPQSGTGTSAPGATALDTRVLSETNIVKYGVKD